MDQMTQHAERDILTDINFRASVTLSSDDALAETAGRAAISERLVAMADPDGTLKMRVTSIDSIVVNTPKGGGSDFTTWDSAVFDGDGQGIEGRRFRVAEDSARPFPFELQITDGRKPRSFGLFKTYAGARAVGQLWASGSAADMFAEG